jgi:hypothetical protein
MVVLAACNGGVSVRWLGCEWADLDGMGTRYYYRLFRGWCVSPPVVPGDGGWAG